MRNNDNNTATSPKNNIIRFPSSNEEEAIQAEEENRRQELLEILDKLRANIASGKMDDVIIIARNLENGLFFTQTSIRQSTFKSSEIGAVAATLNTIMLDCYEILTAVVKCSDIDGNAVEPLMDFDGEGFPA